MRASDGEERQPVAKGHHGGGGDPTSHRGTANGRRRTTHEIVQSVLEDIRERENAPAPSDVRKLSLLRFFGLQVG